MSEEIDKIKAEIKKRKAKWRARETEISKLSPEKRRKRLGLIPPKELATETLEKFRPKKKMITSDESKDETS